MASYTEPSLSTAKGGQIYMGSEITDSLPHLDVLYANEFEGEYTDPEVAEQTEENFYRGAPPEWLNFHTAEQAESEGTGTAFVKRDGYDKLVHQIHKRRRGPRTWTVKLLHQPGSGGTTLAMQVLWDLRKTFRSAVLTGPTSDLTAVANEVIHLFTAGRRGHQNTVLLLLQDEQIVDSLQDSIMAEIATQEIVTHMPVVILLNCVRKVEIQECDHVVLKKELSDTEKQKFKEKKKSSAEVRRMRKPRETQLAACLALLNAYVPGSYLLESQCLDFLNQKDSSPGDLSLEERMEHFSHLIITFPPDINYERNVRMAHPMIAQQCTELMAEAGVTRSDTARHFLNCLCRDEVSPCLLGFAKDMLTKREMKKEENQENLMKRKEGHRGPKRREEDQEKFSRLILDIQKMEDSVQSASVLKVASKIFVQNPFFPQALARFYSLELKNYNRAEMWAKRAKERDPKNSFIADTLGQVYKHHLNSKASSATPREILRLATRAIEAFKDEERLAENQQGLDMQEDGMTKVSNIFNNRGLFGYLQVANIVFESLVNCNKDWRKVLTKNVSLGSVLKSLGDNKLWKFNALINSFRDEVERKCAFFDTYLTYSKPGMKKDDPPYIWRDVSNCYQNYVGDSPPKHLKQNIDKLFQCLKEKRAVTFPGLLSCLDRKYTVSQFKEITTWWGEIYLSKQCSDYAVLNYILAKIMLHNIGEAFPDALIRRILIKKMPLNATEPPELHMLAALMFWPKDKESIQQMHCSYEHAYKKHFRSRYLRPLFFLGKGKGLSRIIHKSILDDIFCEGNEDRKQDLNKNWSKIFKHLRIQERLLKVHGVVRNYKVYATFGDTEIEVDADLRDSLWKSGQVSFYLGFTIRGPVAFDIQEKPSKPTEEDLLRQLKVERHRTDWERERDDMRQWPQAGPEHRKPHPHGPSRSCTSCGGVMDSSDWTEVEPKVTRANGVLTYSLQSKAGRFKCSVSGLRWVCQKNVSIKYQFTSWEKHMERLECMNYTPGGPLLDITVIAGKLDEVHLPHWICLDHNPTLSAKLAVLHLDTDGDFVEPVSEVTPFHVKIIQPAFSPRGVLMRAGFPVKVHCNVLIYKTNTAPLTLHVYLIPHDPALQQAMEQKEISYGYKVIRKPNPDESLQMKDHFILTTDTDTAEICPDQLKLRYESNTPNFFEVFIKNAHTDFRLTLESAEQKKKERHVVWTCTIREDEYQKENNGQRQDEHFVDRHRTALIDRVTNPAPILDRLKDRELISDESCDAARAKTTSQDQMRAIFKFLRSAGTKGKDALYEILKKKYKILISELEDLDRRRSINQE